MELLTGRVSNSVEVRSTIADTFAGRIHVEWDTAARVKGIARLFTEASITARPFFTKCGFVLLASQRVEKHGQVLTNFRMEKRLV